MELMQKSTTLEVEILKWFSQNYPKLAMQISQAKIVKREYSGVGFFIHFDVPNELQPVNFGKSPINGPYIESEEIPSGGDSICFIKNGYIDMLEIYTFGNNFPRSIKKFQLVKPHELP